MYLAVLKFRYSWGRQPTVLHTWTKQKFTTRHHTTVVVFTTFEIQQIWLKCQLTPLCTTAHSHLTPPILHSTNKILLSIIGSSCLHLNTDDADCNTWNYHLKIQTCDFLFVRMLNMNVFAFIICERVNKLAIERASERVKIFI